MYFKIFNNDFCDIACSELIIISLFTTVCRSQNLSMRRPFLRSSCLTPALLVPTWGLVQDNRRGNMAWLSRRVAHPTPPPMILHHCSTAAKNPFHLTRAIVLHPCIPLKASPRILTQALAIADSLTFQPITWWV